MRVFLFRGLMGDAFSTGINGLAGKLKASGHEASVHRWFERKKVQANYLNERASAASANEVAVVGHSLGANSAIEMANNFAAAGLPVRYVATMDATVRRTVHQNISAADNFRSKDIRDKPIDGAAEYARNDLNHIQIDKDLEVHNIIIKACGSSESQNTTEHSGESEMADNSSQKNSNEMKAVLAALSALINSNANASANSNNNELTAILKLLAAETSNGASGGQSSTTEPELTPVNAALGTSIGKALNGRKSAIGIVGLLGTAILPVLFPQFAPVIGIVKALGLGGLASVDPESASTAAKEFPNILTPIFGALASWGVVGKFDKWLSKLKK